MSADQFFRSVGNRAVHLWITPRPASLAESREILRVVSTFGQVEMFRSLKHDAQPSPNTALAIFKEDAAAQQILGRSPVRFSMGRAVPAHQTQADLLGAVRTPGGTPDASADTRDGDDTSQVFQIQANPSRINFRDQVNAAHHHGSFAIDTKSAAQEDLARRVPLLGQSDLNLRAPGKPWHLMRKERERLKEGSKTLRQVWEEGAQDGRQQVN